MDTYACFNCRKGFKRRLDKDTLPQDRRVNDIVKCPDCGAEMKNLGKDLRLPSRKDIDKWLAIEYLSIHNYNFYTCGCYGLGPIPQNLEAAKAKIELLRPKSEGELMLARLNQK
nr:hypothetical protein A6C57_22470 [Fibrella sp. ES10-3-2-2]